MGKKLEKKCCCQIIGARDNLEKFAKQNSQKELLKYYQEKAEEAYKVISNNEKISKKEYRELLQNAVNYILILGGYKKSPKQ